MLPSELHKKLMKDNLEYIKGYYESLVDVLHAAGLLACANAYGEDAAAVRFQSLQSEVMDYKATGSFTQIKSEWKKIIKGKLHPRVSPPGESEYIHVDNVRNLMRHAFLSGTGYQHLQDPVDAKAAREHMIKGFLDSQDALGYTHYSDHKGEESYKNLVARQSD